MSTPSGQQPVSSIFESLKRLGQACAICVVVASGFYFVTRPQDLTESAADSPLPEPSPGDDELAPISPATGVRWQPRTAVPDAMKEEEPPAEPSGSERARAVAAQEQVQQAVRQTERAQTELTRWQADYAPLATNDSGRRLAADVALVEVVESVWEHPRPPESQVTAWRNQLAAWQDELHANGLSSSSLTQVTAIEQAARAAADALETDRLVLDALLQKSSSSPVGERTLQATFEDRRVAAALARETALQQAAQAARAQQTEELQRLIAERTTKEVAVEKETIQNELQRLDDKLQLLAEERQADAKAAQQARDRQQLVKSFERDLPRIKQSLVAFLADGYKHREGAGGTKGPASYGKLVAQGALEPNRQGMQQLMLMATRDNDRPSGPIPFFLMSDYGWSQAPKAPLEQAQALLTKYGPLMVELNLLAK